jgi:hypothetical protein
MAKNGNGKKVSGEKKRKARFPSWSKENNQKRKCSWYLNNRKHVLEYMKDYRRQYPEKRKEKRLQNKLLVLTHYSGNPPKCACCGETHVEFLSIDHINGGGERHRKSLNKQSGSPFYIWLIKNDFPEGYRVLCLNCNTSLGVYGYCPHQREKQNG